MPYYLPSQTPSRSPLGRCTTLNSDLRRSASIRLFIHIVYQARRHCCTLTIRPQPEDSFGSQFTTFTSFGAKSAQHIEIHGQAVCAHCLVIATCVKSFCLSAYSWDLYGLMPGRSFFIRSLGFCTVVAINLRSYYYIENEGDGATI